MVTASILKQLLVAGCRAALVPIEVDASTVTYDTSTYQDIASAGSIVVQQCLSNRTISGGWELAGRKTFPLLVHFSFLYSFFERKEGTRADAVLGTQEIIKTSLYIFSPRDRT